MNSAALLLAAFFPATGSPNSPERLYVVSDKQWHVLDQVTGFEIESGGTIPGSVGLWSLAYDGQKLISIDRTVAGIGDQFFSLHPANGSGELVGATGQNWNRNALDVHPLTGIIYAFFELDMYVVNPATGQLSFAGEISGLPSFGCICNIAFLPTGLAWAIEYDGAQYGSLFSVDVTTRKATFVGNIAQVANGHGNFWDLAVDSSGQLWGTYSGGTDGTTEGVYKIDTTSMTMQLVVDADYNGIAFGPATPESFYCTPKPNSLGCGPVLEAEGLASPTATSGYRITTTNVRNRTSGRLLYGVNGAASNPFAGGTLCLNNPWRGTPIVSSGGSAKPVIDCSGIWTYDLNTELQAQPGPQPGDTLHCQWMGRDPGFAPPDNYALTSALELTLLP